MNRLRAAAAALALVIGLSACTPGQQVRYWLYLLAGGNKETADALVENYKATRAQWTEGRPCADAYDYAIEAGFQPDQWPTLAMLCWRESMDTLTAVSSTHDYCWWQINRAAHQKRLIALGIVDASITELLYDGQKCANAAFDVWSRAGWGAWATYHR